MIRRSFLSLASLAPLIVVPEPKRVYSFLWERETVYERMMRESHEAIRRAICGQTISLPPGAEIEITNRHSIMTDRRIDMRVTFRPASLAEAIRLHEMGFEYA